MPGKNLKPRLLLAALIAVLAGPAAAFLDSNKSIRIGDGVQAGGQSTVNGSITIGSGAVIDGSVETVNGTVTIGDNAQVRNAKTVNGGIRLRSGAMARNVNSVNGTIRIADNVTVEGEIGVVNGKIRLENGSRVGGDASNVNGEIHVTGAEIGGDLSTVNGDVELTDNAMLRGDLIVEKPGGWGWNKGYRRKPKIVIGPGATVAGTIRLEREVELYISDSASVGGVSGEMNLDDAVRFSGQRP